MNSQRLQHLSEARGLSQSDIARLAGVSRQAVSLWFQKSKTGAVEINLHSKNLQRLAEALGVDLNDLVRPLPLLQDEARVRSLETLLLWDHCYPSLTRLIAAAIDGEPQALGRLVQVYGLFQTEKIVGKKIWRTFPKYKKFIAPIPRGQWENVWNFQQNQTLD